MLEGVISSLTIGIVFAMALQPHPALPAPAKGEADVAVSVARGPPTVLIRLAEPTRRLCFPAVPAQALREDWNLEGTGFLSSSNCLVAADGRSFTEVRFAFSGPSRERDRVYPGLTRIGEDGWVVYKPYLRPDGRTFQTRFEFTTSTADMTVLGASTVALHDYVYLGPDSYISGSAPKIVQSSKTPRWLSEEIIDVATAAQRYYGRTLGFMPTKPSIILIGEGASPAFGGWRGDAVPDGVISLRFEGDWRARAADAGSVARFVAHEMFHVWNANRADRRISERDAWLHEGGAEYAALRFLVETGRLSPAAAAEQLGGRLTGCVEAWRVGGLAAVTRGGGGGPYDCGVLVQWWADLELRHASKGRETVFAVWNDILGGRQGKGYEADDFFKAVERRTRRTLAAGDHGVASEDLLPSLVGRLVELGVGLVPEVRPNDYRRAALFPLIQANCIEPARLGYTEYPDDVVLDTDERCGPLSNNARLRAIAGRNVEHEPGASFRALADACQVSDKVDVFLTGTNRTIAVQCPTLRAPQADLFMSSINDRVRWDLCHYSQATFSLKAAFLALNEPPSCARRPTEPTLTNVDGVLLSDITESSWRRLDAKCRRKAVISLSDLSGRTTRMRCRGPLPLPTFEYRVGTIPSFG